jgi:hypothetical protein
MGRIRSVHVDPKQLDDGKFMNCRVACSTQVERHARTLKNTLAGKKQGKGAASSSDLVDFYLS